LLDLLPRSEAMLTNGELKKTKVESSQWGRDDWKV